MSFSNAVARLRAKEAWPAVLLWAGFAACAIGLYTNQMGAALSQARIRETVLLALLVWLAAWPLARLVRCRLATATVVVWLAALTFFVGMPALLATLLLAVASIAVGDLLLPKPLPARPAIAAAIGLAVIAGVLGWMLPLPIHRWYIYLPLLTALVIWRWRALRALSIEQAHGWRQAVAMAPRSAAFAVIVLGLAATGCWLPTMQADDLSYHLGLPAQLVANGAYRLDPTHQVWALTAWLGDVLQSVVQVLARGEARGALNALWLSISAAALWACSTGLTADGRVRWWTLALFGSLPLLPTLTTSMQTELPATACLLALAALIVHRAPRVLWAGAVLCGALLGLKLSHAAMTLPLVLYAAWCWRFSIPWKRLPLALLIVALIGGSSYFYAAYITGNPVLPLLNALFRSPYFALRNFDDDRWHAGLDPGLPWRMSFDTDRYLEASDGGFGFVLVALAGAWLIALVRRDTRAYAWAASLVLLLPLIPLQYARYAFPGLVLLLPALTVATMNAASPRIALALLAAICALNLAFHTNGNYLLHAGSIKKIARTFDDEAFLLRIYTPERWLIAKLRRTDPDGIVLATDPYRPFVAESGRLGRSVSWYDPTLEAARNAAYSDSSGKRWQALFAQSRARWLLVTTQQAGVPLRNGLARAGAQRVAVESTAELWRLPASETTP